MSDAARPTGLGDEAALAWARYLWKRDRGAAAIGTADEVARTSMTDDHQAAAIRLLGGWTAFPELERVGAELAKRPARYAAAQALGRALGETRWLPGLAPLLWAPPFERAATAIGGAIEAMMARAEPGDAARMRSDLVPPARALATASADPLVQRKAARFRRGLAGELATALARCGQPAEARALVDEVLAELDRLAVVDAASARAAVAPALVALGEAGRADQQLAEATGALDDYFDDDVDDHGILWFDIVAGARAAAAHQATWQHGTPWHPIEPLSRRFTGPVTVPLFPPERADHERWSHAIAFHVAASRLRTPFAKGQLARALDVVDEAQHRDPAHAPWLIAELARQVDELDEPAAARLTSWLDALRADRSGVETAIADGARALARSGRGPAALAYARRVTNPALGRPALVEAALALARQPATAANAGAALRTIRGDADEWTALAALALADLDEPPPSAPPPVITMTGAEQGTFSIPSTLMSLVLCFGNGLEGDTRITGNHAEAVLLARGLIVGTGGCRRIAAPDDSPLYQPGDECYRQHADARVFLGVTPVG